MAGLFGLSVHSCVESRFFPEILFWGTSYNRHLGEEHCGIAVSDSHSLKGESHPGLLSANFEGRMNQFRGLNGIGYCGSASEPFVAERGSGLGPFALCFTGNIVNAKELIQQFDKDRHLFQRADEIKLVAKLIVRKDSFFDGIEGLTDSIRGAWFLLVLCKQGIYAAVGPCEPASR